MVHILGVCMMGKAQKSAVAHANEDAEVAAALGGSLERSCVADTLRGAAKGGTLVCRSQSSA